MIATAPHLLLIYILYSVPYCDTYSHYRKMIPNGENVPHPCQPTNDKTWRAVGHFLEEGAAGRNSFGVDFEKNKDKWTKDLCEKDSDGDGKSNGEELGDPNCVWKPGHQAKYEAKSHPGICEPIISDYCKQKNKNFGPCTTSKCSAEHDSEVKEFVLRLPDLPVPDNETTYMCMYYNLSDYGIDLEKTYHVIGYDAVVDNVDIIHHILIHRCDGFENTPRRIIEYLQYILSNGFPSECGMSPKACWTILSGWTIGLGEYCVTNNVGFKIGRGAITVMALQFHWNNPRRIRHTTDSSGIRFYYVEKLRKYNADSITLGATNFKIHPGLRSCSVGADCHGLAKGTIYVTNALNHMHLLGKEIKIEHRRRGELIRTFAEDRQYSYNSPKLFKLNEGIEVKEEDNLKLYCCYSSLGRTSVTEYGDSTSDEMCFTFLVVYPYENVSNRFCDTYDRQNCENSNCDNFCNDKTVRQELLQTTYSLANILLSQLYTYMLWLIIYLIIR